ncbi:MAG: ThuA domain-containing protein [Armatimonadetes bacterium]|nr:ThuA domain-containing protein [Armatimonadota bacterium]
MRSRVFVSLSVCGLLALAAISPAAAQGNKPVRKVLFFTKSSGFQHSVVARKGDQPAWAEVILKQVGAWNGFEVTCTKDGSVFTKDGLAPYDAVMFYTTGNLLDAGTDKQPGMPADGLKALYEFIESGKGFVGLHTATDTLRDPGSTYTPFVGGAFKTHGAQMKAKHTLVETKFPGLENCPATIELLDEWYMFQNMNADMDVITLQSTDGMAAPYAGTPAYPSTWCRKQGQGRVFATSFGHREDVVASPIYEMIVLAGLNWATGNTQYEPKTNAKEVAPNAPYAAK